MQLIEGSVRSYAWGSRSALAELTGRPFPTEHPEAEVWFGAHPAAPSTVVSEDVALDEFIAAEPKQQLGEDLADGEGLPFLLKLLAADKALSLQAHPSKAQAEEGFAAENAQGIALDAFDRNYKDANHKPELVVALSEFCALAGFRPVKQTRQLLALIGTPEIQPYADLLGSGDDAADIRGLFTTWVTLPQEVMAQLLSSVVARCGELLDTALDDWMVPSLQAVVTLAEQYPGDSGVLCSLLLNCITLRPGQALYLDAGQLHAYLGGVAVEIMANSDNVLRSGLTTKHIDVPELMKVLTFEPLSGPGLEPDAQGHYDTPAPDFQLQRLSDGQEATVHGPAIVLAVGSGTVQVTEAESQRPTDLASGHAVWVSHKTGDVRVRVDGALGFIAAVGQ